MPIFRSVRPYITAYGFQHFMLLADVLWSGEAGCVHTARCNIRSNTPEDGHNGARNMLS